MLTASRVVTSLMAASLLGGCASSSTGVRQAKPTDPVVVVTTAQNTTKAASDKPGTRKKGDEGLPAKEPARVAGILGVLRATEGDLDGVFGGVVGGSIGEAFGTGGIGLSGIGSGGGGIGVGGFGSSGRGSGGGGSGTIGLGSIGTIGHGSGFGTARRAYEAGSSSRARAKLGHVVVTGPLTVDVVQRHVDEHRDDVQTCHRLEQARSSSRWGAVTLQFTIDSTGHVSDVQVYESTLYSRDLESCIAHAIGAFEFPVPGAGGSVSVLLPISF